VHEHTATAVGVDERERPVELLVRRRLGVQHRQRQVGLDARAHPRRRQLGAQVDDGGRRELAPGGAVAAGRTAADPHAGRHFVPRCAMREQMPRPHRHEAEQQERAVHHERPRRELAVVAFAEDLGRHEQVGQRRECERQADPGQRGAQARPRHEERREHERRRQGAEGEGVAHRPSLLFDHIRQEGRSVRETL
jgi:hypothetical protein